MTYRLNGGGCSVDYSTLVSLLHGSILDIVNESRLNKRAMVLEV